MRKIGVLTVLVLFLGLSLNANPGKWKCVKGEGPVVKKELNLSEFHEIELQTSGDVELTYGATQKVVVETHQNLIDILETNVHSGSWEIEFEKSVCDYKKLTFYITVPFIDEVSVAGSGSIYSMSQFKADEMELNIAGSGDIKMDVACDELEANIAGSGDMEIMGVASNFEVNIAGSGDVKAGKLRSENCDVSIAGSGDVKIDVHTSLNVSIAGSGDVHYSGSPKVKSSVMGSGDVISMSR